MFLAPLGNGVVLENGRKYAIDVPKPVRGALHLSTHPHSDHTGALRYTEGEVPEEGLELFRLRGLKVRETGEVYLSAGHMFGSAMFLLENGKRVLVTGDFKLEGDPIGGRAEVERVDVLVMDTTFALPRYIFPKREEIYQDLVRWVKEGMKKGYNIMIGVYEVGKAQEVTALLNYHGITPVASREAYEFNRLLGLRSMRKPRNLPSVFLVPHAWLKYKRAFEVRYGPFLVRRLTGWARGMDRLSSHADFQQTLTFIEYVEPSLVVTYGIHAREAASALRERGINALPLTRGMLI